MDANSGLIGEETFVPFKLMIGADRFLEGIC